MRDEPGGPALAHESGDLAGYVLIYLGWAWLFWSVVVLSGRSVWSFPNVVFFYVGSVSPTLAGVAMLYRTRGRRGLRELRDRLTDVRRVDGRWYAVVFLLYPSITVLAAGVAYLVGPTATPLAPGELVGRLRVPLSLLAFVGFTAGAGFVEETGSTGYFLDRLVSTLGPVGGGVVSGTVWASWHVPLFLMDGYFGQASFQPVIPRFFVTFVFLETLFAWIYDNTDRSVLAAALFHTTINLTGEVFAPSQQVRWYAFYLLAVATVLIAVWRRVGASSRRGETA